MKLEFGKFIPFNDFPDGGILDTGQEEYSDGLEKGGIYMAFAYDKADSTKLPKRLLYIGKADDSSNSLGKRINEHGRPKADGSPSDHSQWVESGWIERGEGIIYCAAPLDDCSQLRDIEAKLIFNNQPPCNKNCKEHDCSSSDCPIIELSFETQTVSTRDIKGHTTLDAYLSSLANTEKDS